MRDFNFFSIYLDVKQKSRSKLIRIFLITAIITFLFSGFYLFFHMKIVNLKGELASLEAEMNSKDIIEGVEKYKETKKKLEILNQYYTTINDINNEINRISVINNELLSNIEAAFPKDVFIKVLSATSSEVQMQGVAKSRVSIAELQHNLKEISLFKEVYVSIINKESDTSENLTFAVSCTLKGVEEDES